MRGAQYGRARLFLTRRARPQEERTGLLRGTQGKSRGKQGTEGYPSPLTQVLILQKLVAQAAAEVEPVQAPRVAGQLRGGAGRAQGGRRRKSTTRRWARGDKAAGRPGCKSMGHHRPPPACHAQTGRGRDAGRRARTRLPAPTWMPMPCRRCRSRGLVSRWSSVSSVTAPLAGSMNRAAESPTFAACGSVGRGGGSGSGK